MISSGLAPQHAKMSAARTPVRSLPTRQKKSSGSPASAASVMTWHVTDMCQEKAAAALLGWHGNTKLVGPLAHHELHRVLFFIVRLPKP